MAIDSQYSAVQEATNLLTNKSEQDLLQYVNKCYNVARTQRLMFERQWYINLAFYFGRQYAQWATTALDAAGLQSDVTYGKLYEPAVPPWRVRLVSNKIRPIIRGELAKVTKEKPRGFVMPGSSEESDQAGAIAAENIVEFLWRTMLMNRCMRRASFWTLLTGTAFIKDWYDKDSKDITGVKGNISAEPLTSFHLLVPDMQEEELDSQPYAIHVMAKSNEWVQRHFGKNVNPDSGSGGGGILEQRFLSALGLQPAAKDMCSVKEIYIKPNNRFRDGATCMWAGDEILWFKEGWPYKYAKEYEYPFTKLDHIPTGRFYAESTIVDLISLQKEYNRTRSQIIEAKNRMSKPQIMAVKGSVDAKKVTSEPGLIIFVQPGYPMPVPLQLQNLPNYVIEEVNRIQADMNDISSQHEITKGQTPPGVTAATAISFLQEQDDSKLHTTISSIEEGVERLSRHFLSHVSQFWTFPRLVRVVGENEQFEAYEYASKDLKGNVDYVVEAGSATPTSRAAKQAFITELMKNGWITPQQGLRFLDMAETGRMYNELQKNIKHAQRENLRLANGEQVLPNTFDDDMAHIQTHEDYCKTEEYEAKDDQIKANIQEHLTTHKQHLALMMGYNFAPGDPKLDAIARGIPVQQPPVGSAQNGGQPQLNAGASQGAIQEPSPA